jgi:hypothetical protein
VSSVVKGNCELYNKGQNGKNIILSEDHFTYVLIQVFVVYYSPNEHERIKLRRKSEIFEKNSSNADK